MGETTKEQRLKRRHLIRMPDTEDELLATFELRPDFLGLAGPEARHALVRISPAGAHLLDDVLGLVSSYADDEGRTAAYALLEVESDFPSDVLREHGLSLLRADLCLEYDGAVALPEVIRQRFVKVEQSSTADLERYLRVFIDSFEGSADRLLDGAARLLARKLAAAPSHDEATLVALGVEHDALGDGDDYLYVVDGVPAAFVAVVEDTITVAGCTPAFRGLGPDGFVGVHLEVFGIQTVRAQGHPHPRTKIAEDNEAMMRVARRLGGREVARFATWSTRPWPVS